MSFGESVFLARFNEKTTKGTYLLKENTELYHGTYMGRL
jgi:hypothetical protein